MANVRAAAAWAVAIGAVPITLGWLLTTSLHQPLTGLLLTPLLVGCLAKGRPGLALAGIALAVGVHSGAAVALSAADPGRAAAILDGSAPYWDRTRHWIVTGADPEYDWRHFVPAHLILVLLVVAGGYVTLTALPLMVGVRELDLMNFYVGRLIAEGNAPWAAVLWGWHPWSVIRGVSYSLLLLSTATWSLNRLTGRADDRPQRTRAMFQLGLTFAVLDAVVKVWITPFVRERLHGVLFG